MRGKLRWQVVSVISIRDDGISDSPYGFGGDLDTGSGDSDGCIGNGNHGAPLQQQQRGGKGKDQADFLGHGM